MKCKCGKEAIEHQLQGDDGKTVYIVECACGLKAEADSKTVSILEFMRITGEITRA